MEGVSGQKFIISTPLDRERAKQQLLSLKQELGEEKAERTSIAICLMHSYDYARHEQVLAEVSKEVGFKQVFLSSDTSNKIKIVPRGSTTLLDGYLSPVLNLYIKGFMDQLENYQNTEILFMQSDGGLVYAKDFFGSRALLSGPAGGYVAYKKFY